MNKKIFSNFIFILVCALKMLRIANDLEKIWPKFTQPSFQVRRMPGAGIYIMVVKGLDMPIFWDVDALVLWWTIFPQE